MEHITSSHNPLIARLRKLGTDRKTRRAEGAFLCEGPKVLSEALQWGAEVETVLFTQATALPALPARTRQVEVPPGLLRSVALTESPQGVLFVCRGKPLDLPEELPGRRWLILDGLQDPGNVGTIWRAADAFGADGLILCGCCDPWNPKTVRATMGAVFRLPVYEGALDAAAALLRRAGLPLYATALRADTADVRETDLRCCAVVIGSEGRGVSPLALDLCEKTIKIPMTSRCESLNAAMAAAVVLWEGWRT